jgi:ribosomal protein L11 methyltransferase
MAFGSGEHASTQAALLALHESWSSPRSFLDVGTGSGILLAYAAARGCPSLAACDLEQEAVLAARSLVPMARVVLGSAEEVAGTFACVVANLTRDELLAALRAILGRWDRSGPLVLSGMRGEHEAAEVAALVPARGVARRRGEFVALVFVPGVPA